MAKALRFTQRNSGAKKREETRMASELEGTLFSGTTFDALGVSTFYDSLNQDGGFFFFGGPGKIDPDFDIVKRLQSIQDETLSREEAEEQMRQTMAPLMTLGEAAPVATAAATQAPNILEEGQAAHTYIHKVVALTDEILLTCDELAQKGVDVSAYRDMAHSLGVTVLPPLVLNADVRPGELLHHARWVGMTGPLLQGLSAEIGHRAQLHISQQPNGNGNTLTATGLTFAGYRPHQEPVFLSGQHRGTAEQLLRLATSHNEARVAHLPGGTTLDLSFIQSVREAAQNPKPLMPMKEALALRRQELAAPTPHL